MRVLVIGGTGYLGQAVVRHLTARGHLVTLFHRGLTKPDVRTPGLILGDRNRLGAYREQIARAQPEVVVDLIASCADQAYDLIRAVQGIAGRIVVASSGDVYLANDIFNRKVEAEPETAPIAETGNVRSQMYPYKGTGLEKADWWDPETYDKLEVEGAVLSHRTKLPGTVLRLPMLYGPGDRLGMKRRFYPFSKRMFDKRKFMLISDQHAAWRAPWGYIDNVAMAFGLAVEKKAAADKIYNVCEQGRPQMIDWIRSIADITGWNGRLIRAEGPFPPPDASGLFNLKQDLDMDSSKIRSELGYAEIVDRTEALRRTIEWEASHPPEYFDRNQFDYAAEDAALTQLIESLPNEHADAHQQA